MVSWLPQTKDRKINCSINNDGSGKRVGHYTRRLNESVILYVGSPVAYVKESKHTYGPGNIEVTPVISDNVRWCLSGLLRKAWEAASGGIRTAFRHCHSDGRSYNLRGQQHYAGGRFKLSPRRRGMGVQGKDLYRWINSLRRLAKGFTTGALLYKWWWSCSRHWKDKDISEWLRVGVIPAVARDKPVEPGLKRGRSFANSSHPVGSRIIPQPMSRFKALMRNIVKTDGNYIYQVSKEGWLSQKSIIRTTWKLPVSWITPIKPARRSCTCTIEVGCRQVLQRISQYIKRRRRRTKYILRRVIRKTALSYWYMTFRTREMPGWSGRLNWGQLRNVKEDRAAVYLVAMIILTITVFRTTFRMMSRILHHTTGILRRRMNI